MMSTAILEALGVACELTSTTLSEGALRVMAEECSKYPDPHVLGALRKCCKQLKGKLTLADILSRLDDGRPGPEEAWATVSRALASESCTLVWSEEMREAYGVAQALSDDPIAARMAFKEQYLRLVDQARESRHPARWSVSLGSDRADRERAITEGVTQGRLTVAYAQTLLPHPDDPQTVALLTSLCPKLLS
jgi:hypothetical protein